MQLASVEDHLIARAANSMQAAILFARIVGHAELIWLDAEDLLGLWRASHSHALGSADGAEQDLRPATQILAIAQRTADGAPARIYLSRAVLDAEDLITLRHGRLALILPTR